MNVLGAIAAIAIAAPPTTAEIFRDMAPLHRPSGDEGAARDYALGKARAANQALWRGRLAIRGPDAAGNVAIRVPATGKYAKADRPLIALQAHLDMVLAADGVPPGTDLAAYFKAHPVTLVEKAGVLQSTEPRTSIGADDTVGVAMALRYALDPGIEHPPLDIVLTTREETTLGGARELDIKALGIAPDFIVSLDALDKKDEGLLTLGAMGALTQVVKGKIETAPTAVADTSLEVAIAGLKGGHSGTAIHLPRGNAVVWAAELTLAAREVDPAVRVAALSAGDALNKIPASARLVLVGATAKTRPALRACFARLQEAHDERDAVMTLADTARPASALTAEASDWLSLTFVALPNGVVHRADASGPELPNGVRTSSNFGRANLTHDALELGAMTRSFDEAEMRATGAVIGKAFASLFTSTPQVTEGGYGTWLEEVRSPLVMRVLREAHVDGKPAFTRVGFGNFGMEVNVFRAVWPNVPMLAIGADTNGEHSSREQVSLASIARTTRRLDALLGVLATPAGNEVLKR